MKAEDTVLYHYTYNTKFPNYVFVNNFTRDTRSILGDEISILLFYNKRFNNYVLRLRYEVSDIYSPKLAQEVFYSENLCEMLNFVKTQWIPIVSQCYREFIMFNSSFITLKFNDNRYFIGGLDYTSNFLPESIFSLTEEMEKMDYLFNWTQCIGR